MPAIYPLECCKCEQVMRECGTLPDVHSQRPRPVSVMQVRRYDVFCTEAAVGCGHRKNGDASLWHQLPGSSKDLKHPLQHYSLPKTWEFRLADQKALVVPTLVAAHHIHYGIPMAGTQRVQANTSCARWLHVVNMIKHRNNVPDLESEKDAMWWWPLQDSAQTDSR